MTTHDLLDHHYGSDGDEKLLRMLEGGADLESREGPFSETPLHVATRRRRLSAAEILLDRGAEIDARTSGGKTAFVHAARRGFNEIADCLRRRGANLELSSADRLAVAVVNGRLEEAGEILSAHPHAARTGNPEEDRLLADLAGRHEAEPVELLLAAGADLTAPGLDSGTPLHQAAWFGQPHNARLLLAAGAPLDIFDSVHLSSPVGWAVHGSRYSGGAEERQSVYLDLVELLIEAGSNLHYPDDPRGGKYLRRLLEDASPPVREVLEARAQL